MFDGTMPDLTAIRKQLLERARTCPQCGRPAEAIAIDSIVTAFSRCPACRTTTKLVARSVTQISGGLIESAQCRTWDGSRWVETPIVVVEDL